MSTLTRVLVASDNLVLGHTYKIRLEAVGMTVRQCQTGQEVLTIALDYHPDVMLLDINMPSVSGFDTVTILRNTSSTAHTRIIILAPLIDAAHRQRAKEQGSDDYQLNSVTAISKVIERIQYYLEQDRSKAQPK